MLSMHENVNVVCNDKNVVCKESFLIYECE
jgi:hypothetical protein